MSTVFFPMWNPPSPKASIKVMFASPEGAKHLLHVGLIADVTAAESPSMRTPSSGVGGRHPGPRSCNAGDLFGGLFFFGGGGVALLGDWDHSIC